MKNLCFIDYNFSGFGGIEKVVSSLCNSLCNNYNIHILSLCTSDNSCQYYIDSKVTLHYLNNSPSTRIRKVILNSFISLKNYLNDNNIDIAFMVGHYVPFVALPVKMFVKCKFVFCDHGALLNQLEDKKATLSRRLASKISDKTVVLTKRTMEAYKKLFNIKSDRIQYIYNWMDEEIFKYSKTYNVDSSKIISAGRFSKEKGYDMLIDVAEGVFKRHPDWEWHIYGDGEEMENIKRKISEKDLGNRIILEGATSDIYKRYTDYSIYVMTSYREGLPLTLLEAKANGLPIVSFNCITGPEEIINSGREGYLVDCYNKSDMVSRICDLIENRSLRIEFSNNTLKSINKFDKEKILEQWQKLIEAL